VGLVAASVVAHDPHRMTTQPLWRDENWVAVTLRAPFDRIVSLTSTTPILFTGLLRVTPHWSPSSLRLLPLAFSVAAVVPAFYLGRELNVTSWMTRAVLATGVTTAPAMLMRHDLKQYTAEAFDALIVLWLVARLEREWSRRRLVVLMVVLAASPLLSNAAMFLGLAVVASLAVVMLLRREGRRLTELAVAGTAALLVDLVVFIGLDRRGDTPSLRSYWHSSYIPTSVGWSGAVHFIYVRAGAELHGVGMGPSLVVLGLISAGTVTLAITGFPGLALVVPVCAVEQVAAAGAQQYPLWDPRTSTWFTVLLGVVSLVGATGLVRLVWHLVHGGREFGFQWLGAGIVVGCLALVVGLAGPYARADRAAADTKTPLEDVHGQVQTIEAQGRAGDVVLANVDAGFGLGVYWPAQPLLILAQARLNTFRVAYPESDRVVVAVTISTGAELAAVRTAVALAADTAQGRVWVVLSHWHAAERSTMIGALKQYGTLTLPSGQHGLESVMLLALRSHAPIHAVP
jgi:hypothetical protein